MSTTGPVAMLVALAALALAATSTDAHCPHNGRFDHPHCTGGGGGGGTNLAPTADAGGPYTGSVGQAVQLDGTGSSDPDGPTRKLRYAWSFGDGATSAEPAPSHVYAASGVYAVALTVTDVKGAESTATTTATIEPTLSVEIVAGGLASPVHVTAPPGDGRLFIVERAGIVRVLEGGALTVFLDITAQVAQGGSNSGLFSLAFHPSYTTNGRFFVYFTNTVSQLELRSYLASGDPGIADPASGATVLSIPRPAGDHFGGLLTFGPDGMLYLAVGDGGSGGLRTANAQDLATLLGKMVRIDVDGATPYAIPPDNPFVGDPDARAEIWALGLRNPWRFSFDRATGELYIADVGQNEREEVNAVASHAWGLNYGWPIMEGTLCFDPAEGCDPAGLTLPVFEYDQSEGGCSITGGHVYRGSAMPAVSGVYFYSDFCAGWLRSFRLVGGQATAPRDWNVSGLGNVVSLGEDAAGELYVVSFNGHVYRIVATD